MKRILCMLLCFLLLSGCTFRKAETNTANFYYCRLNTSNSQTSTLVVPEQREISSDSPDLKNLLALYLIGPLDEELVSPFQDMKLVSTGQQEDHAFVELSCNDTSLTDIRFNLACACITMTCLDLGSISHVSISCGNREVTMSRENLLLTDTVTTIETIVEETQ